MPSSSLADLALTQVSNRLKAYGSAVGGEAEEAIRSLLQVLESGLTGTLENAYHLAAIDPGLGKTLSVATFLRTWKAQGFLPASSVLIGLSRLAEIPKYLESAGLDRGDVAIITSNRELNALGVDEDRHFASPVLFTTQQMIERRTRGRSFADAAEFHFHGRPRSLRVWDESILPAEPLTLRVDDLACLPAAHRQRNPELIARLQGFVSDLWRLKDRKPVMVPDDFPDLVNSSTGIIGHDARESFDTLSRLSGRTATVIERDKGNMHLVGSSPRLPSDFSPVVILDASGRVRETYDVWEREIGNLRRLPIAVKDYSNLKIRLWQRAAGKDAVKDLSVEEEIVHAVAEAIASDPSRDWLIVYYKVRLHEDHQFENRLRGAMPDGASAKLHFLHWGNHHGTNEYRHCRNVVLIGQWTHSMESYPAHAAACGVLPSDRTTKLEQAIKSGEYRHNLLQALSRASVRSSDEGLAGTCNAFIIASPGTAARELVLETFPGCSVDTWAPTGPEATGHAGRLIGILEEAVAGGREQRLPKKGLREQLGLDPPNFAHLLAHPAVTAYFDRRAIDVHSKAVVVRPAHFEAYTGEGCEGAFTIADLGLEDQH